MQGMLQERSESSESKLGHHPVQPRGKRPIQADLRISVGDSARIGSAFAAALMESATTQLAPAIAMLMAFPAQLK